MRTDVVYREGKLELSIYGDGGSETALLDLLCAVGCSPVFEGAAIGGCRITITVPKISKADWLYSDEQLEEQARKDKKWLSDNHPSRRPRHRRGGPQGVVDN
jgi:hypothetical protein